MDKKEIIEQLKSFKTDESKALFMVEYIQKLESDYQKFQDIIHDKTEKLISEVLRDDLDISEDLLRWATLGRKYENFVQAMKGRMTFESVDEKALDLLKAARCEIQALRRNVAAEKRTKTATTKDINLMKKQLYVHKRLDEMKINNPTKDKVKKILLEGSILKGLDEYNINRKIKELLKD